MSESTLPMRFLIGDTETCGIGKDNKACEVAWIEIDPVTLEIIDEDVCQLIDPQWEITPGAFEVHGITQEMVANEPTLEEFKEILGDRYAGCDVTLIGHNCLTGDHEVLTPRGWTRLDDLKGQRTIAMQWNPDTMEARWGDCPIVRNRFTGAMYEWDTLYHKGHYTADHRIYTHSVAQKSWSAMVASDLAQRGQNSQFIPVSGVHHSPSPMDVSAELAAVIEMVRADAHIGQATGDIRLKFRKQRKVERCRLLLQAAGVGYSEKAVDDEGTVVFSLKMDDKVRRISDLLGRAKAKGYSAWVLDLSLAARLAILDELQHWDGYRMKSNKATIASSAKASDLQWLATMAAISGRQGIEHGMKPNTKGFSRPDGTLGMLTVRDRTQVKLIERPEVTQAKDASVFCLNTETGAFLVRRKGVIWATGNCTFDLPELGKLLPVSRTVCTLAWARRLITDSANHKLGTLRDHFGYPEGEAHRALADCYTTRRVLKELLQRSGFTLEQFARNGEHTIYVMPWGKHKGTLMAAVPVPYLKWLWDREDLEQNMRESVKKALKANSVDVPKKNGKFNPEGEQA